MSTQTSNISSLPIPPSCFVLIVSYEGKTYRVVIEERMSKREFVKLLNSLFLPPDIEVIALRDKQNNYHKISSILKNNHDNSQEFELITSRITSEVESSTSEDEDENENLPVDFAESSQFVSPWTGNKTDDSFLTEAHALKAFKFLDLNNDGLVHKEEFISSLTQAYDLLLREDIALGWAYSILSPKDLALATASNIYNNNDLWNQSSSSSSSNSSTSSTIFPSSNYYLDFSTFCSWYLSCGFDPLREIFIRAMNTFSLKKSSISLLPSTLSSSCSLNLNLKTQQSKETSDLKMFSFFQKLREYFLLNNEKNLIWWLKSLSKLGKPSKYISFDKLFSVLYELLLYRIYQEDNDYDDEEEKELEEDRKNFYSNIEDDEDDEEKKIENYVMKLKLRELNEKNLLKDEIYSLLETISEICSFGQQQPKSPIQLGYIFSIFLFACSSQSFYIYLIFFSTYKTDQDNKFVSDHILYTHFYMLFCLILYFYSPISLDSSPDILIANPEYLAHAIYLKLLLSIEIKKKIKDQLSLEEFIELFIHGLRIGLDLLEISSGYFYELFNSMVGIENFTGVDASFDAELSFDSPNSKDFKRRLYNDTSLNSSLINYYNEFQFDNSGVNSSNTSNRKRGNSLLSEEEEKRIMSPKFLSSPCDSFEEDQIKSFTVSYNGATITLKEIKKLIGIDQYNIEKIFSELYSLSLIKKECISINHSTYVRYILQLISKKYIDLNVLERSKVDFILDRFNITCENLLSDEFKAASSSRSTSTTSALAPSTDRSIFFYLIPLFFFFDEPDGIYGEVLYNFFESFIIVNDKYIHIDFIYLVLEQLFFYTFYLNPSSQYHLALLKASIESRKFFYQFCLKFFQINEELNEYNNDPNNIKIKSCHMITKEIFIQLIDFALKYLDEESERIKLDDEQSDDFINESLKDLYLREENKDDENESTVQPTASSNLPTNSTIDYSSSDEEENIFKHFSRDEVYPPSSLVLDLRRSSRLLGFDKVQSDDLIDKLGEYCHAGYLTKDDWISYISTILLYSSELTTSSSVTSTLASGFFSTISKSTLLSQIASQLDEAFTLALQIFDAFSLESGGYDAVSYDVLASGLSFLCSNSPIEDRLMVAFTIIDVDRDNTITSTELILLLKSILTLINTLSPTAAQIIARFKTSVNSLARLAAKEAMNSMGIKENGEDEDSLIYYESFYEVAEEFMKLSSLLQ